MAENNVVDFYINDRDEIIDYKLIFINQLLSYRFSNVSRFKNGLTLAEKKEEIREISKKRLKDDYTRSCKIKADEEDYYAEKLHEVEIYVM